MIEFIFNIAAIAICFIGLIAMVSKEFQSREESCFAGLGLGLLAATTYLMGQVMQPIWEFIQ